MLNPAVLIVSAADILLAAVVTEHFGLFACEIWYDVEEIERKEDHGYNYPFKS
jgi:hypothetical protein